MRRAFTIVELTIYLSLSLILLCLVHKAVLYLHALEQAQSASVQMLQSYLLGDLVQRDALQARHIMALSPTHIMLQNRSKTVEYYLKGRRVLRKDGKQHVSVVCTSVEDIRFAVYPSGLKMQVKCCGIKWYTMYAEKRCGIYEP